MTTTIEDTTTGPSEMTGFDPHALEAFMHYAGGQATAAVNAALVGLGDRLGLWKALADGHPATAAELATRTGVAQRYLEEWLAAAAADGLLTYAAATGCFRLTPEAAMVLADEDSPALMIAAFQGVAALGRLLPTLERAF